MGQIYGTPLSPKEQMTKARSIINKSVVRLEMACEDASDRERAMATQIKRDAKQAGGDGPVLRTKVKQLILLRNQHARMVQVKGQMENMSANLTTMESLQEMQMAMRAATQSLGAINQMFDLRDVTNMMRQFEKDTMVMNEKEDVMSTTLNDIMTQDGDSEKEEEMITQVLDELGVELGNRLDHPGLKQPGSDDWLKQRMEQLNK